MSFSAVISTKTFFAGALGFLLVACSASGSGLGSLVLEGHELHASLKTRQLDAIRHVPRAVVPANPHLSTDADFVEAIARSGPGRKPSTIVINSMAAKPRFPNNSPSNVRPDGGPTKWVV